jgi:adenosylcobinamide kinase/adenosylcobinamide-phosphate guanylyltransferase
MNDKDSRISIQLSHIIFITGGTKSGKSEFAEYLAKVEKNLSYVALSEINPEDKKWQKKINFHRKRRPKNWKLIETTDLLNTLSKEDKVWFIKMNSLINLLKKRKSKTFIVGEQVGWSLVSEYKIGNTYIERIGELQKSITKISKDNWLAINGRAIKIDEISLEIPS